MKYVKVNKRRKSRLQRTLSRRANQYFNWALDPWRVCEVVEILERRISELESQMAELLQAREGGQ